MFEMLEKLLFLRHGSGMQGSNMRAQIGGSPRITRITLLVPQAFEKAPKEHLSGSPLREGHHELLLFVICAVITRIGMIYLSW